MSSYVQLRSNFGLPNTQRLLGKDTDLSPENVMSRLSIEPTKREIRVTYLPSRPLSSRLGIKAGIS
ncbi:hypothetical protein M407DRAFT_241784 [Tulasnella calospora MUT 4182]|uniref:Uncharacterized protein n=1 Tax=Tulasnella calospora MUT 4182 TaxID=1051891 RepID=A0A0C3MCB8_9AGAM|nr:hypothetical protein M407DRAFT_241784 [Tulasnella calospora MUT 4182]